MAKAISNLEHPCAADWVSVRGHVRKGYPNFRRHGQLPAGPLSEPDVLLALFSYADRQTGITARVTRLSKLKRRNVRDGLGPHDVWGVSGVLERAEREVGTFDRYFRRYQDGRLLAFHDGLQLDRDERGRGFGTRFCQRVERGYRRKHVSAIVLDATDDLGGYVWARQGFQFSAGDFTGHSRRTAADGVQSWWDHGGGRRAARALVGRGRLPQPVFVHLEKWVYQAVCNEQIPPLTPQQITELGRDVPWWDKRGNRSVWVGKYLLLTSSWSAVKILDNAVFVDAEDFDCERLDLATAQLL